ncbi:hypothetical protein ACFQVA_03915 [Actinomadura keratinilytica]
MNADPDDDPTTAADDWLSRRFHEAEQATDEGFDLSACVREPIHLLGGIQSHGTLLAAEVASGTVVTAADNTARLLGVEARELVGGSVLRVLGASDWEEAVALSAEGEGAVLSLPVTAGAGPSPQAFDLSVHRRDGLLVLEFEPGEGDPAASRDFYQGVRRALGRLRSATSVAGCCATAVREMRALTGFERVVAYRFDGADGPGEVVAESVTNGWEPWLGLWFPATDVPPQARRSTRRTGSGSSATSTTPPPGWCRNGARTRVTSSTSPGRGCARSPVSTWSIYATSGSAPRCRSPCCATGACGG